jgi:metallo-beta-lactamase family protein
MATSLSFLGAARTVTGSRHLIIHNDTKILLDCGLFQGLKELRQRNWDDFIMPAEEIDVIILTHAHIDHSGFIPRLVRQGFRGRIYCTELTRKLCDILLKDCGYLQEEEARYANKKGFSKHSPALPLYTVEDALKSMNFFETVPRNEFIQITHDVKLRFRNAGHIPGSCVAELWLTEKNENRMKIVYSGDLGRSRIPILKELEYIREADYLILESTYGDRSHPDTCPSIDLVPLVKEIHKNKSVLLIPAFAVERTQEVIYHLRNLTIQREIPEVPIYIDSPMAIEVTKLFEDNPGMYDQEAIDILMRDGNSIFRAPNIHFTPSQEASKMLNDMKGPLIIISASGMATGGRILHHLKERIVDPRNIILVVGYQALGTRGRSLMEGAQMLKIHGTFYPVRAKIKNIASFSAHADYVEILKWLRGIKKSKPRTVFLVHGENDSLDAMHEKITGQYNWPCYIPDYLETVPLGYDIPPPTEMPPFIF